MVSDTTTKTRIERMKIRFMQQALILTMIALFSGGCVVMAQMAERKGNKAYQRQDYATAFEQYSEAADNGSATAQYHLAVMYAEGQGIQEDMTKAAALLQQASAQGQEDAQLMLGLFYVYGDGVKQDPAKGAEWIKTSAEKGNDVAMYYLGNLYAAGLGVTKDIPTALYWMGQAKDSGFPVKDDHLTEAGLASLYES